MILLAGCACRSTPAPAAIEHAAMAETVADFASLVPDHPVQVWPTAVVVERVSAAVPWPRGLALVDGRLVVLARGRHRNAGGIDPAVADRCGALFTVDPGVAEPVVPGGRAGTRVAANAELLADPDGAVLRLYDPAAGPPIDDVRMDRPYCTLVFDPDSRNLFVCGYSGVDLPQRKFRKNAADSIHRYDLRTRRWHMVEMHDHRTVPPAEQSRVVPNTSYPHHDPARNPPPHGWLNGPDGGCVVGDWLYCVGKDNHALVRYDLRPLRRDPEAGPPPSEWVLGPRVTLRHPRGETEVEVLGASAVAARDGFLYVGYRTSSVVVRYPITASGGLQQPVRGELIATFEPWDAANKRSANLIDLAFNSRGELFVSCSTEARVWKVGVPDPARPFYGDDQSERPTTRPPWLDLRAHTGVNKGCGNILFDEDDRLYVCAGNYDYSEQLAGAVYRVREREEER